MKKLKMNSVRGQLSCGGHSNRQDCCEDTLANAVCMGVQFKNERVLGPLESLLIMATGW